MPTIVTTAILCLAALFTPKIALATEFDVINIARVSLVRDHDNDGIYSVQFYSKLKIAKCNDRKSFAFHSSDIETMRSAHALLLAAVTTKNKVRVAFELHPSGSHCVASNVVIYDYK